MGALEIPPALVTVSNVLLLALGAIFGTLVSVLFVYQTQNLMKGLTSTERTRRARIRDVSSQLNQSSQNADNSMMGGMMTENSDDKAS